MNKWTIYLKEYLKLHETPPGFYIKTMGCQMNERDSETMAGLLNEMGFAPVTSEEDASVIIVNTCSVRDNADQRFFGVLGQLKKYKEPKPELVLGVCGCMMQQQHIVDRIKEKYPWVDLVFGTLNIHELPELLVNTIYEKRKIIQIWDEAQDIIEGLPAKRAHPFKAYVNIMYGCDNYCSYCVVPYTRGRERSRRPGDIIAEARGLADDGVKEIMLLGQNVNSYKGETGDENKAYVDFPELIYHLNDIKGLRRIRFMTSHPKDLSDSLITAFKDCARLCKVIHLPVQSGSSRLLALMNRRYTRDYYLSLVDRLRISCPNIVITTDFITGFPGETEEDFLETLDLVERVRFDSAFTFLYSIRKGTPAASMEDNTPESLKHSRFNRLVERLNAITAEINNTYLGRVETILAEGPAKSGYPLMAGRTDGGKLVNFAGRRELEGEFVDVRIVGAKTFSLFGELIEGFLGD